MAAVPEISESRAESGHAGIGPARPYFRRSLACSAALRLRTGHGESFFAVRSNFLTYNLVNFGVIRSSLRNPTA